MKKFLEKNWIGFICVICITLLIGFIDSTRFMHEYKKFAPEFMKEAQQFLPITIKDGEIVSPKDSIIQKKYDSDDGVVNIELDTTTDEFQPSFLKNEGIGVYVNKKCLYSIQKNKVSSYCFKDLVKDELTINEDTLTQMNNLFEQKAGFYFTLVLWFLFIIGYYIALLIYSTIVYFISAHFKISFKQVLLVNTLIYCFLALCETGYLLRVGIIIRLVIFILVNILIQLHLKKRAINFRATIKKGEKMKRFFKELLRFFVVFLFFYVLLSTLISTVNNTHIISGIFWGLPILSIIFICIHKKFACFHKISIAWAIDYIVSTAIIIVLTVIIVLDPVQSKFYISTYTTKLLDDFVNSSVSIPDEHIFDGMKQYKENEWKYLKDKDLYVDNNNNPITGEIQESNETSTTRSYIKNGYLMHSLVYNKNKQPYIFRKNEDSGKRIIFFNKSIHIEAFSVSKDPLGLSKKMTIILRKIFHPNGNLLRASIHFISNEDEVEATMLVYGYNKNGKKILRENLFLNENVCILEDKTKRPMTQEELHKFYKIDEEIINLKWQKAPNYPCQ